MKAARLSVISVCLTGMFLAGCASPLPSIQKQELKNYELKGLAVQDKSPGLAAGLGILPGGGSFYTGHYGLGIVNLLFWPLSVLWDPVSGYDGAIGLNYAITKQAVAAAQRRELAQLDYLFETQRVSQPEYMRLKRALDDYYAGDNSVALRPVLPTAAVAAAPVVSTPPVETAPVAAPVIASTPTLAPVAAPVAANTNRVLLLENAVLRASPLPTGRVLGQVRQSTYATISGESNNGNGRWLFIDQPGQRGWVSANETR